MEFLLENGADVNVKYFDEERKGMTLLHEACLRGDLEGAKLLLRRGIDFNLRCLRGRNCLDFIKMHFDTKTNKKKETLKNLLYKYTVKTSMNNIGNS